MKDVWFFQLIIISAFKFRAFLKVHHNSSSMKHHKNAYDYVTKSRVELRAHLSIWSNIKEDFSVSKLNQANMKIFTVFFFLTVCSAAWFNRKAQHKDMRHQKFVRRSLHSKTSSRKMIRVNIEDAQKVERRRRVLSYLQLLQ